MAFVKKNFSKLFTEHPDGSIEPKSPIMIGSVRIGPGMRFSGSAIFNGINIFLFKGRDFEVEDQDGVNVIKGVYKT